MLLARAKASTSCWWTVRASRARSRTGTSSTGTGPPAWPAGACSTGCWTPAAPPSPRSRWTSATFRSPASDLVVDGVPVGLGPRRAALDKVLVDAAVEAGAELREGFAVDDLTFEDGRVTGIQRPHGREEVARFVIGADGRNSAVAKRVQARRLRRTSRRSRAGTSRYWSGVPASGLELYSVDRRVLFAFPTNDGLFAVFVAWPIEELAARAGATPSSQLLEPPSTACPSWPSGCARAPRGTHLRRHRSSRISCARRAGRAGRWWGTPAATRTPTWRSASATPCATPSCSTDALGDALSGRRTEEGEALADYRRRRDEATMPDYQRNMAGEFKPTPPELLETRAAVSAAARRPSSRLYMVGGGPARAAVAKRGPAPFDHSALCARLAPGSPRAPAASRRRPASGATAPAPAPPPRRSAWRAPPQRLDLHLAEARQRLEVGAQLGAVGGVGPYARGVAVVAVAHVHGQIVHALGHRAGEAVDRGPGAEHRLEVGGGQRRGVDRAEPLAQRERARRTPSGR